MKRQRLLWLGALALLCAGLVLARPAQAQSTMDPSLWFEIEPDGQANIHFYFFWSETCPHCRDAHPVVDQLPARFPWLVLHSHEISRDQDNAMRYAQMAAAAGEEAMYVPAFIFCGNMVTGWDSEATTGAALEQALEQCHAWALENHAALAAALGVQTGPSAPATAPDAAPDPAAGSPSQAGAAEAAAETANTAGATTGAATDDDAPALGAPLPADVAVNAAPAVALPFIGALDVEALSLPALTLVIAGLDAFNPCAFFVLMFLLSLMVHARDRRRMLLIGVTFVFFSGLIYFVFMSAWLNLFLFVGELRTITLIAGLVAMVIALLNIKDFFWFKQGVSLSIPDRAKPGLYQRSRNLLKASSFAAILAGTAVLAVAANSYELLCTSGFPMVYTRMLTLNELPTGVFYAYLAAYNVIYVIPLLLIVVLFTVRFGQHKLTESEGRVLKLLSGLMMLLLGGLLVFAPDALNQVATAILLLLITLVVTGLIVLIDRRVRPEHYRTSQPA